MLLHTFYLILFVGVYLPCSDSFYCVKMSSHQTSAKPRSSKCRHFCLSFDLHNYCPTCRESGKGDDLCVTNQARCNICKDLSAEQHAKIKNQRRYTRKQKSDVNTSKDDLELLGDDEESFKVLKQTWKGLLRIYFLLHFAPNPYALKLCQLKLHVMSHQPQVPPHCKTKLKISWNPWAIRSTSN